MTFAPYKKIGEGTSHAFQREAIKHQKNMFQFSAKRNSRNLSVLSADKPTGPGGRNQSSSFFSFVNPPSFEGKMHTLVMI